jgi:hypothetical protein
MTAPEHPADVRLSSQRSSHLRKATSPLRLMACALPLLEMQGVTLGGAGFVSGLPHSDVIAK